MFLENDDFANSVDLIQFDDIELDEKNECKSWSPRISILDE